MIEFKPGDVVVCLNTSGCESFIKGNQYVVKHYSEKSKHITFRSSELYKNDGWYCKHFEISKKYFHQKDFEKRLDSLIEND